APYVTAAGRHGSELVTKCLSRDTGRNRSRPGRQVPAIGAAGPATGATSTRSEAARGFGARHALHPTKAFASWPGSKTMLGQRKTSCVQKHSHARMLFRKATASGEFQMTGNGAFRILPIGACCSQTETSPLAYTTPVSTPARHGIA